MRSVSWRFDIAGVLVAAAYSLAAGVRPALAEPGVHYLSDLAAEGAIEHRQQWGKLGLDAAANKSARGSPIRIGRQVYRKGLGHHANGEILVKLNGQYEAFHADVGVQWQGSGRGSVIFRVEVDGREVFRNGPMSDSDPPKKIRVSLKDAKKLRLVADDAGDGISYDMADWAGARLLGGPHTPAFRRAVVLLNDRPATRRSRAVCGFSVIAERTGPQMAVIEPADMLGASVRPGETVQVAVPVRARSQPVRVSAEATLVHGTGAEVEIAFAGSTLRRRLSSEEPVRLQLDPPKLSEETTLVLTVRGVADEAGVRWRKVQYATGDDWFAVPLRYESVPDKRLPPPEQPRLRPSIERKLIEWDWRMQDGIHTSRVPSTYPDAIKRTLDRGEALISDLRDKGSAFEELAEPWNRLRSEFQKLSAEKAVPEGAWETLWRRVHALRRKIVLANPLARIGPLVFVKQVPSAFSHQLTQYYGRDARPGGGLFELEKPGTSFACRQLASSLPVGSYQHPEVSYDGRRILFAYCHVDKNPPNRDAHGNVFYHLYEVAVDGSGLRQLTDGPFDDFSPCCLPEGKILFVSTRRGGFHRCGRGPCPVYTLAVAETDGSDPHVISYHETHEWDPAVLNDGRVIYTRWDYVDRHAVHYQQLWTTRPDGSNVRIYYGNNTFSPVGIWEARAVPGSHRVMATAAAHHAMTAGSIILLDVRRGLDGPEPITRLTPDALFPESETRVIRASGGGWHAPVGVEGPVAVPPEAARWPGHCYRSPWPLSEKYFLAAYSFDSLIGEPTANRPNMFGIYLVDCFGNKELLYRDLNIASLWPVPLRIRSRPDPVSSVREKPEGKKEGTFFVQDVYAAWPPLPKESIKRLRIVQVLPKSTPHINNPPVGIPNASPGKQVLGTVPVEPDGSAYFAAPAGIPLAFQAIDDLGRAVQIMRSITYLQPGEHTSCVGCHEPRTTTPLRRPTALALSRPPSPITPGPDGSRPFSYPRLVQPVLDRHCVRCHSRKKPDGGVVLTGEPAGHYSVSYNALASRVSYSAWGGKPGDFRQVNSEPVSKPGFLGARGSRLMTFLSQDHYDVDLSREDMECLATWMDANALFYGTFDPADQARQQRGEPIAGPALQ